MNEPLPILKEKAIQIAGDYLEQSGQIDDREMTGWLLPDTVEHMSGAVRDAGWLCRTAPSRSTNALTLKLGGLVLQWSPLRLRLLTEREALAAMPISGLSSVPNLRPA
jgi:hypothetical protein